MANRTRFTAAVVAMALLAMVLVASAAWASLYGWNEAKRPPISLADALSRAEELLGDDAANRYCVSVSLYGDETGQGKEGAWNLLFAAADGSKKHVYLNMQGKSDVSLWNGPIDRQKHDGCRTGLADVRRRLTELLLRQGIEAEYEAQPDYFIAKYKVRDFQVYPKLKSGGYADDLQTIPGPQREGIWLKAEIADKPDLTQYGYFDGPYWTWRHGNYLLTEPGKYLLVDLRYGPGVKHDFAQQIQGVFGEKMSQDVYFQP